MGDKDKVSEKKILVFLFAHIPKTIQKERILSWNLFQVFGKSSQCLSSYRSKMKQRRYLIIAVYKML